MSYVKVATLSIVGALGLLGLGQQANAMTLQDLINNGTPVMSGNVVYTNFADSGLAASNISVNFTNAGVQFSANWNTLDAGANHSVIQYDVTGTNVNISGVGLDFGGIATLGGSTASVAETISTPGTTTQLGRDLGVFYFGQGDARNQLTDSETLTPASNSIHVLKSIDLTGTGNGSQFGSLNFVENTYTTVPGNGTLPPVPEPMTLALLPLALAGLGLRKKLAR